jgi:hypothetical protein
MLEPPSTLYPTKLKRRMLEWPSPIALDLGEQTAHWCFPNFNSIASVRCKKICIFIHHDFMRVVDVPFMVAVVVEVI